MSPGKGKEGEMMEGVGKDAAMYRAPVTMMCAFLHAVLTVIPPVHSVNIY